MSGQEHIDESPLRAEAIRQLGQIGFPTPRSEDYRRIPITSALTRLFSEEERTRRVSTDYADVKAFLLGIPDEHRLVFVNGQLSPSLSSLPPCRGLSITPLPKALASKQEPAVAYLGKIEEGKDPFALFNTAFWQDGALIHVAAHARIEAPLVVYHIHDAKNVKVASHTKLLIVLEQGANLSLIEQTNSTGSCAVFNTLSEEIVLHKTSVLNYTKLQSDPGLLYQVNNTSLRQHDQSHLTFCTFSLAGKLVRNNLNLYIEGEGCNSNLYGLYLPWQGMCVGNQTIVDHRKPNSTSNELYKGIVGPQSQATFNGKIYVRPQAQLTNAFQANRNILIDETAAVYTKPQLEIWADDVKCSHGCTSGQLDAEALFYLRARGLSLPLARAMLLEAFAQDVVTKIGHSTLNELIGRKISNHLAYNLNV